VREGLWFLGTGGGERMGLKGGRSRQDWYGDLDLEGTIEALYFGRVLQLFSSWEQDLASSIRLSSSKVTLVQYSKPKHKHSRTAPQPYSSPP